MNTVIAFATGNPTKFDFIMRNITCPPDVSFERVKVPLDEIQAPTVADVCRHKALQAWNALKKPVLVHDSGMLVTELNGFPGPYTNDMIRVIGAGKLFEIVSRFSDRSIVFEDCLTFVDDAGVHQFVSDSGNLFCFADRKAESSDPAMPLNGIVAFADQPDKPFADIENFADVYKDRIAREDINTCWRQFSNFLIQYYKS